MWKRISQENEPCFEFRVVDGSVVLRYTDGMNAQEDWHFRIDTWYNMMRMVAKEIVSSETATGHSEA